jgi:hypothetical protein
MADEDYDVLRNGKVVGRIYDDASAGTPPDMRWFWSVTAIVPATPGVTNGTHSTSIYNERGQLTGRAERRPDGSTSFFKRAWPVRRLDPTTLTRERNHMSRYLLVLVALLASGAAAAEENARDRSICAGEKGEAYTDCLINPLSALKPISGADLFADLKKYVGKEVALVGVVWGADNSGAFFKAQGAQFRLSWDDADSDTVRYPLKFCNGIDECRGLGRLVATPTGEKIGVWPILTKVTLLLW